MRWANYTLDAHAKAGGCSLLLQRLAGEVVQRIRQLRHATPLRDRGGAGLPWMQVRTLKKVRKFVDRQLNIAQDRTQQTRTNRLTGMNGNCGGPAVGVPEKDVTAAGAVHSEACSFEGPESKVLCRMREETKADPSTHHPQTEKRLGPRSLRMTVSVL
jgi:hypothetical protein